MPRAIPNLVGETGTVNTATNVVTLTGPALTDHRTFAAAVGDGLADGDTVQVLLNETGTAQAVWSATYDTTAGTLTRTEQETINGTLTNGGTVEVLAVVSGDWSAMNPVVQTQRVNSPVEVTTTSTAYQNTGLSITFTPKFADSTLRITVCTAQYYVQNANSGITVELYDVTNAVQLAEIARHMGFSSASNGRDPFTSLFSYQPGATTTRTISVRFARSTGAGTVGWAFQNTEACLLIEEVRGV